MHIWEYILLFFSVIFGGALAFYFPVKDKSGLQMVLSFSGAYILGITVLHMMPMVFSTPNDKIGLYILGGFFLQLLLEQISSGVEHGHIHVPHDVKSGFVIQVMLGLCLHAFLEGLPLPEYGHHHHEAHEHGGGYNHLLFGIVLHKAPAAFALVLLFVRSGFRRNIVLICLIIFALMSPLGALVAGQLESQQILGPAGMNALVAVVVGSFLHIATTIIFEMDSSTHHRISLKRLGAISFGLLLALLTMH